VAALGLRGERWNVRTALSFLLMALFGLMLFQSRRFIEYFPAFVLIFAAFAVDGLPPRPIGRWRWGYPAALVALVWRPGQATPIHDHRGVSCAPPPA